MKKKTAKKALKKKTTKKRTSKKASPLKGVKKMKTTTTIKGKKTASNIIRSINPYTEEVMNEFMTMSAVEVKSLIAKARGAFSRWRDTPIAERLSRVKQLGAVLRQEKRSYAELMTREMGKPIKDAMAEVEKSATLCDYYAANAGRFLAPEIVATEAKKSYVSFEPLGVILAIEPWNFPFWQVFRAAVPAASAGNVVVLKHASNVPMTALAIEDAFHKAGFPEGVFKTLLIDPAAATKLIDDDLIDAVALTGSNGAGEVVGAHAGGKIKKLVLELGGSDPFIVLDDADVEKAGRTAANARMVNSGQSCIAAKRFIVMESVVEEFTKHFVARLREMKIGDPMDETTDIGPLARKDIRDGLKAQLRDAKLKGAKTIELPQQLSKGWFFAPSVVLKATANMKVLSEEVFGPIAPIVTVKNEDEAIVVANDTEYGLGAAIWTKDTARAERLARRIESGFVAINDMVRSDPRLPFGGVKKSGVGRELSHFGLREFVNIKTVVVKE